MVKEAVDSRWEEDVMYLQQVVWIIQDSRRHNRKTKHAKEQRTMVHFPTSMRPSLLIYTFPLSHKLLIDKHPLINIFYISLEVYLT